MKLIIVSGRSGSGKTTALHVLEDLGYYCVDNLPVKLLPDLIEQLRTEVRTASEGPMQVAVGVDARNVSSQLVHLDQMLEQLATQQVQYKIIYLDADDQALLKRYSETRRKHPITNKQISLTEALTLEQKILEPIERRAGIKVNTSYLSLHQLRDFIKRKVYGEAQPRMAVLFYSFGYKHGLPPEADLVFDVRCLPNPYWVPQLRHLSGLDQPVVEFLKSQSQVQNMLTDIIQFLDHWLPRFEQNNRSYMTVAIGCTGGMHRSVFFSEQLAAFFEAKFSYVQVRHRQLD